MNKSTSASQNLARRLIALEAARDPSAGLVGTVGRACERLRVPLAKFVGVDGFRSLLSRALAMAKAEAPSLDTVQLRPDGSLEGFDGLKQTQDAEAGVIVLAQLLGLLVTFIGEPLMLRLVRDAWPDSIVTTLFAENGERS